MNFHSHTITMLSHIFIYFCILGGHKDGDSVFNALVLNFGEVRFPFLLPSPFYLGDIWYWGSHCLTRFNGFNFESNTFSVWHICLYSTTVPALLETTCILVTCAALRARWAPCLSYRHARQKARLAQQRDRNQFKMCEVYLFLHVEVC